MGTLRHLKTRLLRNARRSAAAVAGVICFAVIVACGSSGNSFAARATGGPLLRYAQCMRAHRVARFPDPRPTGGLIIPNDINTEAPAFKSAQQACAKLAQAPGGQKASESRRLQLLGLARCMRAHGVPSFPDPTTSPPPPSSGNAIGGDGWYLALGTAQQRQSPTYQRAAAKCGARTF
ncbi:MAG: hypothetical protein ACTHQQ_10825 [Solirubrobacteraceae bacterium]